MRPCAAVLLLALAGAPASAWILAQAGGNLPPGGIVDGAEARTNDAEGTAPDGRPAPGGRQGEGRQSAAQGGGTTRQGASGAEPPGRAATPDKP